MTISLRTAGKDDVEILAEMNKELIADEGSTNPMTISELAKRMTGFLMQDWRVDLLLLEDRIVGYALYQFRGDEYMPCRHTVYLRQYFIKRAERNRGLGKAGFDLLRNERFGIDAIITLEVLTNNERGQRFWSAIGFEAYSATLKLNSST